jgi:hypothetical protein
VDTVGELVRHSGVDVNALGAAFDEVPVPGSLSYAFGLRLPKPETTAVPALPDGQLVVLVGPELVRADCIEELRAFAAAGNLPVANTWGAKGVFAWDSPHHMGTCGLQARDFELLGFAGYDAIVATGIDPLESPPDRFALAPLVEVDPSALAPLAERVTPTPGAIAPSDLYQRLAKVAQPGYVDDRVPLHPARAVADLRAALPPTGIVAADPGPAGLWVARTFPTTDAGTVVVPATVTPGIAAVLALTAAVRGRPAVAVTTAPLDGPTRAVLDLAARLPARFVVEAWGPEGGTFGSVAEHLERLRSALRQPGATTLEVPVDLSPTAELVDAAGPVIAWGGATP